MPTRPYTVVVQRDNDVLYVAAEVASSVRIPFSADNFLLFFALVVQVWHVHAAYMVCVCGFRGPLLLFLCVDGSGLLL